MKILIVTSEVTFVPDNYNQFLENLLIELSSEDSISIDLVILTNNSPMLFFKGLYLAIAGGRKLAYHLIKNSLKSIFKDRKYLVKKYGINIYFFSNPNSAEFHQFVKEHQTELLINARTRFIYKKKILKIPKIAAINIHHGLLPDFRGVMCDLWALYEDRPTGFSVHIMEKKIDEGAIVRRVQTTTPDQRTKKLDFSKLIFESSKIEGVEIANIIKTIKKTAHLPIEKENISINPVYTKNPDFYTIRKMLKKGIEL